AAIVRASSRVRIWRVFIGRAPGGWVSGQEDRTKIVDVGQRRTGDDGVAELLEEAMAVVLGECVARTHAHLPGARECVRRGDSAGDLLEPVDAVGVASECVHLFHAVELDGEREQELDIAPATTLALDGDGGLAARQDHARARERLFARGYLVGDAGEDLADVLGLAL